MNGEIRATQAVWQARLPGADDIALSKVPCRRLQESLKRRAQLLFRLAPGELRRLFRDGGGKISQGFKH